MTVAIADAPDRAGPSVQGAGTLALALLVGVLIALGTFLTDGGVFGDARGDNDSLLRLVEVRDLLAGQGWFDLTQYRMGPEGGFPMHWSRLVDLPLAMLVVLFGETAAQVLWPAMLFAVALWALATTVVRLDGDAARFPALVIGAITLYATGLFRAGSLDHHNAQLALVLVVLMLLTGSPPKPGRAFAAGLLAAVMAAIAAEAVPLAAAACLAVSAAWALSGTRWAAAGRAFGLGFALGSAAALVGTVPLDAWTREVCDAYSGRQAALSILGGLGLALAVSTVAADTRTPGRLARLAALGLLCAAAAWLLMRGCLADPYADVAQTLRTYWLAGIAEAQPVTAILRNAPATFAGSYVTPALALALLGFAAIRGRLGDRRIPLLALLATAFLVSLWQVRGAQFAVPLAAIMLAGWVARRRRAASDVPSTGRTLAMIGSWLAALAIVWQGATGFAAGLVRPPAEASGLSETVAPSACYRSSDYAALAAEPATTVLAVSNLGSPILVHSPHRVLAGPYHRNNAGNLAALDAFMGSAEAAHAIAYRQGATLLALCPGNDETQFLARAAPRGLLAGMLAGRNPAWLIPIGDPETPLRLFRIAPID